MYEQGVSFIFQLQNILSKITKERRSFIIEPFLGTILIVTDKQLQKSDIDQLDAIRPTGCIFMYASVYGHSPTPH